MKALQKKVGQPWEVRDCEHCENYVAWDDRPEIKSCRKWDCEYEPLPEPYKEGE